MKTRILVVILAILTIGTSCKKGSKGERTLLPNVTGNAGELVVILPKNLHKDSVGLAYKEILTQDVPFLPQSEPLFDLIMIPPEAFTDIFKSHRNIIFNEVKKSAKKTEMSLKRDVWAAPQTILYVSGPSYKSIKDYIEKERETIVTLFEQAERDRVVQNAIKYEQKSIREKISKKYNVSMRFPKGYRLNFDHDTIAWISFETPLTSQGIILYTFPYTDKNTFTVDYLLKKRNEFVKTIEGPSKGSYMITSEVIKPELTEMMYKNRYYAVMRGFWDVYKHPMGGPFISHITLDEERQRVIVAEAYVYAPSKKKRNYLRQVEALLYTLEIIKP
ncbi:DUF4837 family protein [Tenuifilum thalassicum]|jgi:hypothetical protein|uniref:DUF4837 family protein n=1 Tax=Tenuifilum thalassicum TaxID=2590900 RepID=A0A7D4BCP5_9BACT|nr:DUF4837 family protein [Tenuifilum thalassicum]QKG78943.1 DUF4837 family protein [Tenuifilum thalassicum]